MELHLRDVVTHLARRDGRRDHQYFRAGRWRSEDARCWRCNVGPGTAAAVLWRRGTWRRAWLKRLAVATFSTAIARHRQEDGSFGPPNINETNNQITTMFFGVELGIAYHELEPGLNPATAARWRKALQNAAYFVAGRSLNHYVNGNINLGNTLLYRLAGLASRDPELLRLAESSWSFTQHPDQRLWPGFGLQLPKRPKQADCSDGRGYLTEQGSGGVGYDPEYAALQGDVLARAILLTDDPSFRCLLNLVTNQVLKKVGRDFLLRTGNGTRHTEDGRRVPYTSAALPVLAFRAGRHDLQTRALAQISRVRSVLRDAYSYSYGNLYREVGLVATTLMALRPALPPRVG